MSKYKHVKSTTGIGYEFIVYPSGDKYWYLNGVSHKVDGPSVVYPPNSPTYRVHDNEYYLYGKRISEESFYKVLNCPIEELPLYINTKYAPIAKERLGNA